MKQTIFAIILIFVCGLVACATNNTNREVSSAELTSPSTTATISLPTILTITDGLSILKIAPIPANASSTTRTAFDRYTQVIAPNGKPITIYAQNQISDLQIIQARNTLIFWLTAVPDSTYGADKSTVANQMAENEAMLMLLNGSDGDQNPPELNGQPLYETELIVPGSAAYINNNYESHRDATFEEILHLVHDTGIGVDGANAQTGALPAFQTEIRAATDNAIANNFQIWPTEAATNSDLRNWYDELSSENSLTQEYLAAVIDSYYGLWGAFDEADAGMWGFYLAKTRADIVSKDPMGNALMAQFFSPYLTYNAQLDSSFNGTFQMSFDSAQLYTHKSQYLLHATLTGNNHANLLGNDQDNNLAGNSGDNQIDGAGGNDTVHYPRAESNYTVTNNPDGSITVVGDGTDTLINIEQLIFNNQ